MDARAFDFSDFIAGRTADFTGREWVFEAVDAWLADPHGPTFFIITGGPGAGKSAIAARLTQTYKLAAHHFCIARDADTTSPYLFARSLSHQLSRIEDFAAELIKDNRTEYKLEQEVEANYGQVTGYKIENLTVNAPSAAVAFCLAIARPIS